MMDRRGMALIKRIQFSRSLLLRSSSSLSSSSLSSSHPLRSFSNFPSYQQLHNIDPEEVKAALSSEGPLSDLDALFYQEKTPEPTPPAPHNPFLPPTNTFIPAGKSWSDSHPSSSSSAIIPSQQSSSSSPASRPYIYQSGGFIPANSISALAISGTRASVSGIVATVFGGYGFIGRHILAYLGRIGTQMIIPYRGSGFNVRRTKLAGELGQVVPIPYDWTDLTAIGKSLQRSNIVVNAMGASYETTNFSFDDVHVKCTYKIAEAAKKSGNVERFIHISSIGADPRSPSAFLRSKGEGENIVRHFFPDATILRLAPVFGTDDHFINGLGRVIYRENKATIFNNGRQLLSPVYVNDVAQAVLASIAFGESLGEIYHLVGPKTYSKNDIINAVLKASFADPFKHYELFERQGLQKDLHDYWQFQEKRDHLTDHKQSSDSITYFLRGLFTQLAQYWRTNPDLIPQSYANQILPTDIKVKTLADLGISSSALESYIDQICLPYRGTRAPDRFVELGRKPFSAARPMPY